MDKHGYFCSALAVLILFFASACDTGNISPEPSPLYSLEFGRTLWGTDYAKRSDVPAKGILFSVWTKIPDQDFTLPWNRGNMDVFVLHGDNWHIRFLDGNCSASSDTQAGYNANSMIFEGQAGAWLGDYSYFPDSSSYDMTFTSNEIRGWVWAAWYVRVTDDSFIIHQWLKFGSGGRVIAAGDSTVSFDELRSWLIKDEVGYRWTPEAAQAWIPSQPRWFRVGSDHANLCRARLASLDGLPSLEALEAISSRGEADTGAWADYRLDWSGGAPNLKDRSGNGRDLVCADGGTLHEGALFE